MEKVKDRFIDLLGVNIVDQIIKNNWVKFEHNSNINEIMFLEKDNIGDTVRFFTVCYNENNKKWFSKNCIDIKWIEFDSYDEMKQHITSIKKRILDNGFNLAELP